MITDYENIYAYIKKNLRKKRVRHSFEVSKLAESLCKRYDIDPGKGRIAGISHDIARDFDNAKLKQYAQKDGNCIHDWENEYPILLHGRAGAEFIKEKWSITDSMILEAIRYHTCGKIGMSILSQILFVADYCEPGRKHLNERERCNILSSEINMSMLYVLRGKFKYLRRKGKEILQTSLLLYNDLCEKLRMDDEKKED